MTRKWLVLLAIVSMLIVVVAGCAPAAPAAPPAPPPAPPPVVKPPVEKVTWKMAAYTIPTAVSSQGIKWFFEEVVKRSEGRFEVKFFWTASLCPPKEQPDGVKSGLMEASGYPPAYYPSKFPLYYIGTFPLLYPITEDTPESWRLYMSINDEWLQTPLLKEEFAKWNSLYIAEDYPVFYVVMGKVRISNLEDLKGTKLRAVGAAGDLLRRAGAAPVSITLPETYDALVKGTVEGMVHAWPSFYAYKIHEISKYWSPGFNLGQIPYAIVVSIKDYEALPQDIKAIFEEVKEEFPDALTNKLNVMRRDAVEAYEEAGIEFVEFSPKDYEKLREMSKEIWKKRVDKLEEQGIPGREAFNSLQDIFKKHVAGYEPYYLK